jgi:hypothetical protein
MTLQELYDILEEIAPDDDEVEVEEVVVILEPRLLTHTLYGATTPIVEEA